jgi:hypothetical protein
MAGLDPAIYVLRVAHWSKTWMPGSSPGMTVGSVFVIASEAKQSILSRRKSWIASSQVLLAMTLMDSEAR